MEVAADAAVMDWDDAARHSPLRSWTKKNCRPLVMQKRCQSSLRMFGSDIIERRLGTFELARCKLPEYFDQVRTVKRCFLLNNPSPLDPEFDPDSEPHGMQIKQLEARLMTCKDHYWNQDRWWVQQQYMSGRTVVPSTQNLRTTKTNLPGKVRARVALERRSLGTGTRYKLLP